MKIVEKIINYPILVLLVLAKDLIEIIREVYQIGFDKIVWESLTDWYDFGIKFIISVFLWLLFKAYVSIKRKFEDFLFAQNTISMIRCKLLFLNDFRAVKYYNVPGETEEEFRARTPEGFFDNFMQNEYELVKQELIKRMSDKKVRDIDLMLAKLYKLERLEN